MNLHRFMRIRSRFRGAMFCRSSFSSESDNLKTFCKYFEMDESKAKYLQLKHPIIRKLNDEKIRNLIHTFNELGFSRRNILEVPSLFSILPITLKFRYKVLQECGIINISAKHIASYLVIIKKKTVGELKSSGLIKNNFNVENQLANHMTEWPTSLTTLICGDTDKFSLYHLRLKIMQRYLELMLDLSQEEYSRGLKMYPTIKHRPLQTINQTVIILQRDILMPHDKLKSNIYLIHADPENLMQILYNFKAIGGINMREILRIYPRLALKKYKTLFKTRRLLEEYGVSPEAQTNCFDIYTLSPETIKQRLENAKKIPEFNTYYQHPRFLKLIFYNNVAFKRLMTLYKNDKKCISLNKLSDSSARYDLFEKGPGDRHGRGRDLIYCICQGLGKSYTSSQIRQIINRHPFWINIPIVQVEYVYEQLNSEYSSKEIYENCIILLYPWNKIREVIHLLKKSSQKSSLPVIDQIDLKILNKSQKLSLILYLLEKKHYFTGNGVWTNDYQKTI